MASIPQQGTDEFRKEVKQILTNDEDQKVILGRLAEKFEEDPVGFMEEVSENDALLSFLQDHHESIDGELSISEDIGE